MYNESMMKASVIDLQQFITFGIRSPWESYKKFVRKAVYSLFGRKR